MVSSPAPQREGSAVPPLHSTALQAGIRFLRVAARKRATENPMISLPVAQPLLAVRQLAQFLGGRRFSGDITADQ
jgi:hypothetical protein